MSVANGSLVASVKLPPSAPAPREVTPVATSALTPSRPSIKLKVGGASRESVAAASIKPSVKVKGRKLQERKASPAPLPSDTSFIDDGSADLLEEVIAIEREKDQVQRKHRASVPTDKEKEREKPAPKLVIGNKRKKPAEDEISALATPPKREKPMTSTPNAGPSPPTEPPVHNSPAAAPPRNGTASRRDKDKGALPTPTAPEPAPESATRASTKGKEKEASVSAPTPSKVKKSPPQTTPINEKKCKDLLKILMKSPDARIFLKPVDPVLDGCPTYYDEIKEPMDFSTLSTKLNEGAYKTMEDFAQDVDLIFRNCRTFNPPTTYPVNCADALERVFKKEWAKITEKKLAWNEKRSLQSIMNKLVADPLSFVFREPVDPIALGIPTYHDVIPRKDARDLRTIREKLDADKYDTVEAWEADMDLMIENAILFNGIDSEVGQVAVLVRNKYREMLSSLKSSPTKRKGSEKGTPQPSKKAKLG